jgi:protein TonB
MECSLNAENNLMKTKQRIPSLNDMLFEKRNKAYGAYDLRTNYNSRLTKSLAITISVFTVIILYYTFSKPIVPDELTYVSRDSIKPEIFIFNQTNVPEKQTNPPFDNAQDKPAERKDFRRDDLSFKVSNDTVVEKQSVDTSLALNHTGDTTSASSPSSGNSDTTNAKSFAMNVLPHDSTYGQASVDKIPEFPGGIEKFYAYLVKRIRYSREALDARVTGRLYVSFVIDENGLVRNIKFLNNLGYRLDESVKEVLIKSPQWEPGMLGDKAVKTEMRLPVSFNLRK